jgi:hypothetical protein
MQAEALTFVSGKQLRNVEARTRIGRHSGPGLAAGN